MNPVKSKRETEMNRIALKVARIADPYAPLNIFYCRETAESIRAYSDYERERFHLVPGDEYFFIYQANGALLYTVNVTADAPLTAASELMELIARKF